MCYDIYIGNTQKIFNKIMDVYFSSLLSLLKNGKQSDSFTAHSEQKFRYNMSCTYLYKFMAFEVVSHIYSIVSMNKLRNLTANYV